MGKTRLATAAAAGRTAATVRPRYLRLRRYQPLRSANVNLATSNSSWHSIPFFFIKTAHRAQRHHLQNVHNRIAIGVHRLIYLSLNFDLCLFKRFVAKWQLNSMEQQ